MSAVIPFRRPRPAALLLLLPLLAGCSAGDTGTTSAAEASPGAATGPAASVAVNEPAAGSGTTGSGACGVIDDSELRAVYPELEPIDGSERSDGTLDCHLWLPEQYVEQTIAAEGLDRTYYDGVRRLGVIITVNDELTKTDFSGSSWPVVTTDGGLRVQMPPVYDEDGYIAQQYNAGNGSPRDVTATFQGFSSDVPDKEALDQAIFKLLDRASALP